MIRPQAILEEVCAIILVLALFGLLWFCGTKLAERMHAEPPKVGLGTQFEPQK